jgi:hypothetical protein
MSTAIVRTHVPEGFVIAADGRARGAEEWNVVTDEAQKIFAIGGFLAYSISGTPSIASRDATEVSFDFVARINTATQALSTRRFGTLADYAKRACGAVHQALKDAKLAGQLDYPDPEPAALDPSERGSTIVKVLIDGYHKGAPSRVKVRFFHEKQVLERLEVLQQELVSGAPWYQGSEIVFDLICGTRRGEPGDQWVSAYEKKSMNLTFHPNTTLDTHARMAHAYISACSGPEAHAIDPQCAGIGGHIHIATITPKDGFQWVPGFEPVRVPRNI